MKEFLMAMLAALGLVLAGLLVVFIVGPLMETMVYFTTKYHCWLWGGNSWRCT